MSPPQMMRLDPQLGLVPVIPLPYYRCSWRTLWRTKFCCPLCDFRAFRTEQEYGNHYALTHIAPAESGEGSK
jgi:hypothetical protein